MLTCITYAAEKENKNKKEFANFNVYKAWHFFMYNLRKDSIFESETLMSTHWIKRCETCLYRATPRILTGLDGF